MGTYFDKDGTERDITGLTIELPNGDEVPQVYQYTHLGVSIQSAWPDRHTEARQNVLTRCTHLIQMIGKLDMLGPLQLERALDLAVSGTVGYTGRSTPIDWDTCNKIEER